MKAAAPIQRAIPRRVLRRLLEEKAFLKALARRDAERRRGRTQQLVSELVHSTPERRIDAAKARAAAVFAKVDDIAAKADLKAAQAEAKVQFKPQAHAQAQAPTQVAEDLSSVRIGDLAALFASRDQLPGWLRERIKNVYAKVHWKKSNGRPGYFNVAVHKNRIPIDKALAILAHLKGIEDGAGLELDPWVDSVIECGLFTRIRRGKFEYQRRCQDGEHCELCNYLNISDGLKTLYAAYSPAAFNAGVNWFALTVAPRVRPAEAQAVGRTLTPSDWVYESAESAVYKESRRKRALVYDDSVDQDEAGDWLLETRSRSFLGAVQFVFGKLVKNGWLDGIRGRVENSVEFLPYASHQHWHATGSSRCEHDPQRMARFIKEEVDDILACGNVNGVRKGS